MMTTTPVAGAIEQPIDRHPAQITITRLTLAIGALGTALMIGWFLYYGNRGFDFTDEGFYLNWISHPSAFDWSATQFGFVYHPAYLWLDGDIAALRRANVLLTFGMAWLAGLAIVAGIYRDWASSKLPALVISAGFAVPALMVFENWLLTPNYNALTLQCLLGCLLGLALSGSTGGAARTAGRVILGIGGALLFLSKPPVAAAFAACAAIYLLVGGRRGMATGMTAAGVATVLVLGMIWGIDGSIGRYVDRLVTARELYTLLDAGHAVGRFLRIDDLRLTRFELVATAVQVVFFVVALRMLAARDLVLRSGGMLACLLVFGCIAAIVVGAWSPSARIGDGRGLLLLAGPVAALALVVLRARASTQIGTLPSPGLLLVMLVLPYVYGIGSNNNYWHMASAATVFWPLASLFLLGKLFPSASGLVPAMPVILGAQLSVAVMVNAGVERPYRQPESLRLADHVLDLGSRGGVLQVSADYGRYVETVMQATRDAGFDPGTPIIDMTGQSPSLLFVVDALAIGQPWTVGGYRGSLALATAALRRVPCASIGAAWILHEPGGPRSIPDALMARIGASLEADYQVVAQWSTAPGAGGFDERRHQILLKPRRNRATAEQACEAARATPDRPADASPSPTRDGNQ